MKKRFRNIFKSSDKRARLASAARSKSLDFANAAKKVGKALSTRKKEILRNLRRNPYEGVGDLEGQTSSTDLLERARLDDEWVDIDNAENEQESCEIAADEFVVHTPPLNADIRLTIEGKTSQETFPSEDDSESLIHDFDEFANSQGGYMSVFLRDMREAFSLFWSAFVRLRDRVRQLSLQDILFFLFPIASWLPEYSLRKLGKDVQAGLVVGCMLVPQSMGYASVAGLPVEKGLYSSFLPLIAYSFFGTSRQLGVGPVAMISLLVSQGLPACSQTCISPDGAQGTDPYPVCPEDCPSGQRLAANPEYARLAAQCALVTGALQAGLAPALGLCINFVPHPVIAGFTSAGGLIIAMSQLEAVMGYPIRKDRLQDGAWDLVARLPHTHLPTCAMGLSAIALLFCLRQLGSGRAPWCCGGRPVHRHVARAARLPWALAVVGAYTAATAGLGLDGPGGVRVVGEVPAGLPPLAAPAGDGAGRLVLLAGQMVVIGYLESMAVETTYSTALRYPMRPAREAVALGLANLCSGLAGGYPVTGSFSRSAANAACASQSPLCNLVAGLVVLLSLLLLTPLFRHMPACALAAIVVVAATGLVDLREAAFLWRSSKKEWGLMALTFLVTGFVALEYGILASVALCLAEMLYKTTRPKLAVVSPRLSVVYLPGAASRAHTDLPALTAHLARLERAARGRPFRVWRVEGDLTFAAAARLRHMISRAAGAGGGGGGLDFAALDLGEMDTVDTTALAGLLALVEDLAGRAGAVFLVGVPPSLHRFLPADHVRRRLAAARLVRDWPALVRAVAARAPHPPPLPQGTAPHAAAAAAAAAAAKDSAAVASISGGNSAHEGREGVGRRAAVGGGARGREGAREKAGRRRPKSLLAALR